MSFLHCSPKGLRLPRMVLFFQDYSIPVCFIYNCSLAPLRIRVTFVSSGSAQSSTFINGPISVESSKTQRLLIDSGLCESGNFDYLAVCSSLNHGYSLETLIRHATLLPSHSFGYFGCQRMGHLCSWNESPSSQPENCFEVFACQGS